MRQATTAALAAALLSSTVAGCSSASHQVVLTPRTVTATITASGSPDGHTGSDKGAPTSTPTAPASTSPTAQPPATYVAPDSSCSGTNPQVLSGLVCVSAWSSDFDNNGNEIVTFHFQNVGSTLYTAESGSVHFVADSADGQFTGDAGSGLTLAPGDSFYWAVTFQTAGITELIFIDDRLGQSGVWYVPARYPSASATQ